MSWFKDRLIESEADYMEHLWANNLWGVRDAFPDEAPMSSYDLEKILPGKAVQEIRENHEKWLMYRMT